MFEILIVSNGVEARIGSFDSFFDCQWICDNLNEFCLITGWTGRLFIQSTDGETMDEYDINC